jgi:cytochrome b pre-mRNA-processing protein 3
MFRWLGKHVRDHHRTQQLQQQARQLYDAIVAQARQAVFYRDHGIPDTVPGRFEMLAMHMFLVLERLKVLGDEADPLAQQLVNVMFDDMDDVARELGVGDMAVAPKVKKLARSFRSRLEAYERVYAGPEENRASQLGEILIPGDETRELSVSWFKTYLSQQRAALEQYSLDDLTAPDFTFHEPGDA